MELRVQTSLLAGLIAIAIGITVLLRPRPSRVQWGFGAFCFSVAAWYLSTSAANVFGSELAWRRVNLACAILLPVTAAGFLRLFVDRGEGANTFLWRGVLSMGLLLVIAVFVSEQPDVILAAAIFAYLFSVLGATLLMLWQRATRAPSRFERARLRFLVLMGALAATFTAADYLPLVGLDIPPVGTALTLVFLYILSQSILRYRLLDLYELAGRLGVLTALSFTLAAAFWLLRSFSGGEFFMHAVAAAVVVLLVYDPLRLKVEQKISQFLFRERFDLDQEIHTLRRRLAHVLEIEHLPGLVMDELERSRRVTHAALYLVDTDMRGYRLAGHLGPTPLLRLELAAARPLLDALREHPALVIEALERDAKDLRDSGKDREAETQHEVVQTLDAMQASVCVGIVGEREVYGFLCVRDERLRDAFAPEEVQLLAGLANQMVTAIENSRLYQRMKERDRLAAMGEMAAGLAHEIRNPLGAIKASAQYLNEAPQIEESGREFLDIIVEEADRLNRVVTSFLDYANPTHDELSSLCQVNAVVERTAQVLAADVSKFDLMRSLVLARSLPAVHIDPERLRQVLINLIQNALQAIEHGGTLRVETSLSEGPDFEGTQRSWVEVQVTDTGPGVPQQVLANLFQPFVTTRQKGTGLGLAISRRIVRAAGGEILVRTRENHGSTFTVRLPAALPSGAEAEGSDARAPDQSPAVAPPSGAFETPSISGTKR
ncbi:MAG: ATP-binding protein [Myxococcales bacterium]